MWLHRGSVSCSGKVEPLLSRIVASPLLKRTHDSLFSYQEVAMLEALCSLGPLFQGIPKVNSLTYGWRGLNSFLLYHSRWRNFGELLKYSSLTSGVPFWVHQTLQSGILKVLQVQSFEEEPEKWKISLPLFDPQYRLVIPPLLQRKYLSEPKIDLFYNASATFSKKVRHFTATIWGLKKGWPHLPRNLPL